MVIAYILIRTKERQVKKVIIIIIVNLVIGLSTQVIFPNRTTGNETSDPAANMLLPMIVFADPMATDSDTVRIPEPSRPPLPVHSH